MCETSGLPLNSAQFQEFNSLFCSPLLQPSCMGVPHTLPSFADPFHSSEKSSAFDLFEKDLIISLYTFNIQILNIFFDLTYYGFKFKLPVFMLL